MLSTLGEVRVESLKIRDLIFDFMRDRMAIVNPGKGGGAIVFKSVTKIDTSLYQKIHQLSKLNLILFCGTKQRNI